MHWFWLLPVGLDAPLKQPFCDIKYWTKCEADVRWKHPEDISPSKSENARKQIALVLVFIHLHVLSFLLHQPFNSVDVNS